MAPHYRAVPKPGKIIKSKNKPTIRVKAISIQKAAAQAKKVVARVKSNIEVNRAKPSKLGKLAPKLDHIQTRTTKRKVTSQKDIERQNRRTVPYNIARDVNIKVINDLKNVGVGKILVMLACGPSINEVDFSPLFGHSKIDIMCVNKPNPKIWHHAKYWVFCDQSQYNRNSDLFYNCDKTIINSTAVKARKANKQVVIKSISGNGFSRDITRGYNIGRSTVYANMQTALWMNYDYVYIFGIDMCEVGGKLHFYGENPDVKPTDRVKRFKNEAENYSKAFHIMKEDERKRFKVCTSYNKWEFADLFGKIDHKIAINIILGQANK